ncbi:MAG: hypothetical protein J5620_04125 [Alphaproteobacteria bacterium]|nr:hypothetical protein [Alphaproteobacteria bacterium]
MRISILSIGTIASVLAFNAYAVSSTVTSQDYVDARDALKQNLIEATGNIFPVGSVVETTDEDGEVMQRGICNSIADTFGDCRNDFLVTRDLLESATNNVADNLPETTVTYKTCYQEVNGDCILWNLSDKDVYGAEHCTWSSDCSSGCPYGGNGACNNGVCDYSDGCMMY